MVLYKDCSNYVPPVKRGPARGLIGFVLSYIGKSLFYYRKGPKLLFILISCISIIFCVQIVKYLYKLMVCWIFHIIWTRNSQDMDDWIIYLHFLGHVRLGDSANKCACTKIKNRNIWNFGIYIELFHSLKHF